MPALCLQEFLHARNKPCEEARAASLWHEMQRRLDDSDSAESDGAHASPYAAHGAWGGGGGGSLFDGDMPQGAGRLGKAAQPAWPPPSTATAERREDEQLRPDRMERLGLLKRQDSMALADGGIQTRGQTEAAGGEPHDHVQGEEGRNGDEEQRGGRRDPAGARLAMTERSGEVSTSVVGSLISGMVRSGLSAFGRAVASLPPLLRHTLRDAGSAGALASAA